MTKIEWGIVLVMALIIAAIATSSIRRNKFTRICLEHGWPEMQMAYATPYCVKRVNQTDTVVALSKLIRE